MNDIKGFRFFCQSILPLVYDESLSYYEVLCKVAEKLNEVIKAVNSIEQGDDPDGIDHDEFERQLVGKQMKIDSDCDHANIIGGELGILVNGMTIGSGIASSDVMLKSRDSVGGSIAVFGEDGNVVPLSFDNNVALATLNMLGLFKEVVLGTASVYASLVNGICVEAGTINVTLDNLVASGGIYHQNVTLNKGFHHSFSDYPVVIIGSGTNLNNRCWCDGVTSNANAILRASICCGTNDSITATLPYIAIGKREVYK